MGVYIKGIGMPTNCSRCIFKAPVNDYSFDSVCKITREECAESGRNKHCPLTEVPEPHGRLIDEDNLIVATKAFLPWSFETEAERGQYFQLDLFKTIIEETPTVIERNK